MFKNDPAGYVDVVLEDLRDCWETVTMWAVDGGDEDAFLCLCEARKCADKTDYEKDGLVGRKPCSCLAECGHLWPTDAWYAQALKTFNHLCPRLAMFPAEAAPNKYLC
jgi:hypothetical protein